MANIFSGKNKKIVQMNDIIIIFSLYIMPCESCIDENLNIKRGYMT